MARADGAVRGDDASFLDGRGCYTTARVASGRVRWLDRHVARLRRDAAALSLPDPTTAAVREALCETARAAFERGDGVVRVQASADAEGAAHLVGIPRPVGVEREAWRASTSSLLHAGLMPWGGAKISGNPLLSLARLEMRSSGVDEVLLRDAEGLLVEGARSNLVAVTREGRRLVLGFARGAVHGLGVEWLRDACPDLEDGEWPAERWSELRELVAINSVRGARALVEIDGEPVGDGRPGEAAARLDALYAAGADD